jgi:hypothetical protein
MSARLEIAAPPSLVADLTAAASAEMTSVSSFCRRALLRAIDEAKNTRPVEARVA